MHGYGDWQAGLLSARAVKSTLLGVRQTTFAWRTGALAGVEGQLYSTAARDGLFEKRLLRECAELRSATHMRAAQGTALETDGFWYVQAKLLFRFIFRIVQRYLDAFSP